MLRQQVMVPQAGTLVDGGELELSLLLPSTANPPVTPFTLGQGWPVLYAKLSVCQHCCIT